jgi:hypothetical protein
VLCQDPTYLRERQAQDDHLAKCRAAVETLGEEAGVLLMEAHVALLRKQAVQAHQAETPKQVADVARSLGPVAANMAAARNNVGLSTETIGIQGQGESFAAAMDSIFGPARKPGDNRDQAEPAAAEPPQETPPDGTPAG